MKYPKCDKENTLRYQRMYQYAKEHRILKNGQVSKNFRNVEIWSDEWSNVYCTNCNTNWTSDDDNNSFNFNNDKLKFDK